MEATMRAFLTSALDIGQWLVSSSGCFSFAKEKAIYPVTSKPIYSWFLLVLVLVSLTTLYQT
jgi:hypothetical protein